MPIIYHPTPLGFARLEDERKMICSCKVHDLSGDDATESTPVLLPQLNN